LAFLSVNQKEESLRELEKILKSDSNNIESLLLKGKIYLFMGNIIEGGKHFWKVNQLNAEHSEIKQYVSIMKNKMQECLLKANTNIIKGKFRMGILWCGTALSIYPNHPELIFLTYLSYLIISIIIPIIILMKISRTKSSNKFVLLIMNLLYIKWV